MLLSATTLPFLLLALVVHGTPVLFVALSVQCAVFLAGLGMQWVKKWAWFFGLTVCAFVFCFGIARMLTVESILPRTEGDVAPLVAHFVFIGSAIFFCLNGIVAASLMRRDVRRAVWRPSEGASRDDSTMTV